MSDFYPEPQRYSEQREPQGTAQQAKTAAGEVVGTARGQAQTVAREAKDQTRRLVGQMQNRISEQAQHQGERAAHTIREWADELTSMGDSVKPDSPMHGVVHQIADRGRQVADYLEQQGLANIVQEVQDFARRRPGLFLAGAVAAGFLVGRAAKAATSSSTGGRGTSDDAFRETTTPLAAGPPQTTTGPPTLPPTSGEAAGPPSSGWPQGDLR